MKRFFIISLIMCSLFLSACENKSIGIIGGSDGPTAIFVGEENGNTDTVKKPIRMIKVDGQLYYDSGKVSENTPRCGTMDGALKQVGAQHEIPKNDNECNFEGAEGYQHATSITKEVPIDGKWVIFKLFDDPELDMDIFKYCFYIKGHLPNAEKDSELVVLTEDINYAFDDFSRIALQSKAEINEDENVYLSTFCIYEDVDKWGITLSAKDITNKGLTILCEQFGGSPTGELQTGEAFSLEYSDNGDWKPVPTNPLIDYAWHQVAYMVKKNDVTEFKVEWEWLYGELKSGYYKLKKEFTDFRATGDFGTEMYELYFTVE